MRYAIVVNLDRCVGCRGCEVACKQENGIPLGERWNKVIECGPYGEYPDMSMYFIPVMCQQCEDAPCVNNCPTGASYRDPQTNTVLVNKELCIGCKYCMIACPYGVRQWHEEEHCVEKCTLCSHLTINGELPMCVRTCAAGARFYGDLDDPDSDAARALAQAPEGSVYTLTDVGNHPATHYILPQSRAEWHPDEGGRLMFNDYE